MKDQTIKDIDRAFKALEERDELLDKIRAEIEQIKSELAPVIGYLVDAYFEGQRDITDRILSIIDKYKAESEE